MKRERLYTSIFGQCTSPCGQFIVCCSNFGRISLFRIEDILGFEEVKRKPCFSFRASSDSLNCIASSNEFIIVGSDKGDVVAWRWSDIISKIPNEAWSLSTPKLNHVDQFDVEVNSLLIKNTNSNDLKIYAACGDNRIHFWDGLTGKNMGKYEGHTKYVHVLDQIESHLVSGSEDGSVFLWDDKNPNGICKKFVPSSDKNLARPHIGKWIKSLTVHPNKNLIVCGGGPHLSLWHLGHSRATTVFDDANVVGNYLTLSDGILVSGGNEGNVRHWTLNGDMMACVPTTSSNIFHINILNKYKAMTVVGNSHNIDICKNFNYKSFSLPMF